MPINEKKLFEPYQPLAAIAITITTAKKLQPLCENIGATLWVPPTAKVKNASIYSDSLSRHLAKIWSKYKAIIFSLTTGAVVRLISPLLQNKHADPAIIAIDPQMQYVISLCGGHQGGADLLSQLIAHQSDATPIVTSASDSLNLPGIDVLGIPYGWGKGEGNWTEVSATLARSEKVQVIQEAGSTFWRNNLPSSHTFDFSPPSSESTPQVWISTAKRTLSSKHDPRLVQWHPRVLWVGIGCERGISKTLIETAIKQVLSRHNLAPEAIAGLATIDIKANERGILQICQELNLPLYTFTAAELSSITVPNPSDVVEREVGTPSVAEAAAIRATQPTPQNNAARLKKVVGLDKQGEQGSRGGENRANPSSIAPENTLLVPKQIIRQEGEKGALTLAIAQSTLEYTGREGKIYLVGIGPGNLNQITPAAKTAITQADAIIGYGLYIDLILPLLRPGQIVEALPLTQEKQRAQRAIALAQWGLTVGVVSSGDCGIYGMAGLVLEQLTEQGWHVNTPTVEVFPGITAMQAAAAKVGAPLMHDFCAVSLSDLLTSWQIIEKRLIAAATADFVTAIYNPRSQSRTQQIIKTQEIFLAHRDANTPVAIVNSVYREEEQITLTTLDKMLNFTINMLTTVIIGNSSTKRNQNWMITPRKSIVDC